MPKNTRRDTSKSIKPLLHNSKHQKTQFLKVSKPKNPKGDTLSSQNALLLLKIEEAFGNFLLLISTLFSLLQYNRRRSLQGGDDSLQNNGKPIAPFVLLLPIIEKCSTRIFSNKENIITCLLEKIENLHFLNLHYQ